MLGMDIKQFGEMMNFFQLMESQVISFKINF